jgi:hypothetical protein
MQQLASRPRPDLQVNNGGAPRSQIILIVALLLFSVAGLASGFSVGALTHSTLSSTQSNGKSGVTRPPVSKIAISTPKPAVATVKELGCPQEDKNSSAYQNMLEQADGNTTYTFASHATDQTGGKCDPANKPIHTAGIMIKLWLTNRIPAHKILHLPADVLMHTEQLPQPITGTINDANYPEVANALQFDPNTKQLHLSNDQGQANWTYKLDPNLNDGDYSLVILTDWQGKVYNWSWYDITVKKQG